LLSITRSAARWAWLRRIARADTKISVSKIAFDSAASVQGPARTGRLWRKVLAEDK
jgi:hypothetical protein